MDSIRLALELPTETAVKCCIIGSDGLPTVIGCEEDTVICINQSGTAEVKPFVS